MARTLNRLSAFKVEKAKRPGMHADGGGLYLRVAEGGSKQWIFRYVANGRLRDMGIGPCHTLDLAKARERARQARELRLDGIDPIAHKHAQRAAAVAEAAKAMTFKQCAEGFIRDNERKWSSVKHRDQWKKTLQDYVYPTLGNLLVASIDTPLVLKVIKPLWERVPETASRVRGRIEQVLGWATVHHYRSGDNPARWQGLLEHALPARNDVAKVKHHAALPYTEAPAFMAKLREDSSVGARCLEFIALTAARLGEGNEVTWNEIDFEARAWTIPAKRMKAKKEHRVPLSDAAMAVLEEMRTIQCSDYVFPGARDGRPIGENTVGRAGIKLVEGGGFTTHGLRSTFRDWAAECTSFPNEVVEMALAHAIPSAVEKAYRRGDLFEKRRRLMDAWADYCGRRNGSGAVVPIRKGVVSDNGRHTRV
jgi:integrase